jgi:hypothetical protein
MPEAARPWAFSRFGNTLSFDCWFMAMLSNGNSLQYRLKMQRGTQGPFATLAARQIRSGANIVA